MIELLKKIRNWYAGSNICITTQGTTPTELTPTQKLFLLWNAERLNIPLKEMQERYFTSWTAIPGGHAGSEYRSFNELSYKLFQVFCSDVGNEIYIAYQIHGLMHFLRMLSYPEPEWTPNDTVIRSLSAHSSVDIIDYGCGLAQSSRSLACYLKDRGLTTRLFLVDIPTIRKDFLLWLGTKAGIETHFIECTAASPMPDLPSCDVCIATEFFEHVYDPLSYFERIHKSLRKNGLLVTNIADHNAEFMHVSPSLLSVRKRIHSLSYEVLQENQIYRKNSTDPSLDDSSPS